MKNKIQSILYVIFLVVTVYALSVAFAAYENPFDLYENPIVTLAIIAVVSVVILREIVNNMSKNKLTEMQNERDGIIPEDPNLWIKKLMVKWTRAKAVEEEEEIILDHEYDGIRELDNSLPPWWIYLFYATILFGVVYLVRFHVFDDYTQEEEYERAVAEAQIEINKYKQSSPDLFDVDNVELLTAEADLKRGKAVFNLNCASCHQPDGGGAIGPNLTDEYWILGGGIQNVFNTVYNGGRSGKGMVAWNKTLKPGDIAKVSSYVISLQGTTPAKAKEPEGELWKDETPDVKTIKTDVEEEMIEIMENKEDSLNNIQNQ